MYLGASTVGEGDNQYTTNDGFFFKNRHHTGLTKDTTPLSYKRGVRLSDP